MRIIITIVFGYVAERSSRKTMKKTMLRLGLTIALAGALTACGAANPGNSPASSGGGNDAPPATSEEAKTRTVSYLGKEYELPAKTERIVIAGAVEAMEDSIVLGIKPVGAISYSGKFPPLFASITENAEPIGEKTEPSVEKILSLQPDVIIGSTKFKPEVMEKLSKIASTIPYSHIATDWESNLKLLGELSGKQQQAEQAIAQYKADLETAKTKLGGKQKDKKVLAVRIRSGQIYIYPESVFFNPVLYQDLGFAVPDEVKGAKAQELLSAERFAEMNPDYLFVQFSADENKDKPEALKEMLNHPVLKNVNAFKNGAVYDNVVDPLAQGGTAYSKIEFLKAVVDKLAE